MSIHDWTPEQRQALADELDKAAAREDADPDWVLYVGQILELAGIPNTAEHRKAVLLGGALSTIV